MIKLWQGDCLDLLPTIKSESIDMVLCDLPYNTTSMRWDTEVDLGALWNEYKRVLNPNGCVVLFGSQPFTSKLVISNLPWFRYELIWDKNKCGSPGLAKLRPMKVHENILIFAPHKAAYHPIMEAGTPYSRKSSKPEGYVGKANNHGYGLKPRTEFTNEGTRYPKSILRISRDFSAQQQVHPTQKPVPVLEWLIKTYTKEGALVLDNCMGSGSTGVACIKTKRNFIGIELKRDFYATAASRIHALGVPFDHLLDD